MKQQKMYNAMYMIWQVMKENGQQKPIAVPAVLVSVEEAFTATPATTRVVATTTALLSATRALVFAQFYMCRTLLRSNGIKYKNKTFCII